jgi:hypothetical protein
MTEFCRTRINIDLRLLHPDSMLSSIPMTGPEPVSHTIITITEGNCHAVAEAEAAFVIITSIARDHHDHRREFYDRSHGFCVMCLGHVFMDPVRPWITVAGSMLKVVVGVGRRLRMRAGCSPMAGRVTQRGCRRCLGILVMAIG